MIDPAPTPPGLVRLGLVLTGLALLVLTVLLLMPGSEAVSPLMGLDKLWHFLGFFGLVLPLVTVLPRLAWAAALAAAVYGGVIELIQPSFGRGAEWGDALANLIGAATGALVGRALHARLIARPPRR